MKGAEEFDFIVVGGGSAGAAVVARLTEDPRRRVLLLEAGGHGRSPWLRIPAGVAKILVGQDHLWRFKAGADAGLQGRELFFPRGKGLGGTSLVNGMFWVRGNPREYDRWRDMGNPGWGYEDVLPHFIRMENYVDAAAGARTRGTDGPMVVSRYGPRDPLTDAFLRSCAESGIPEVEDYNDGTYLGGSLMQLSTRGGLRWCVREGYLRPAMRRRNLIVRVHALAQRVLFENLRAFGVEYRTAEGVKVAHCRHEVIVCAGAVQSPQLLELSGVGDANRLCPLGITPVHDLPAVGEHLRDHVHGRLMVRARHVKTLNEIMVSPFEKLKMGAAYLLRRDGLMSTPGVTAHAYAAVDTDELQPAIKLQLHHLSSANERDPKRLELDAFPGFSIGFVHQQPTSLGSVHVNSADVAVAPSIVTNHLSTPEDLRAYIAGFRLARKVVQQPALANFVVEETRPGAHIDTDAEIEDYLRRTLFSSYHPTGTCRMGVDDGAHVVDSRLRVHGLFGIRVADASIMPTIPSSNTNAPAIMIGEKAAEMVLQELGT